MHIPAKHSPSPFLPGRSSTSLCTTTGMGQSESREAAAVAMKRKGDPRKNRQHTRALMAYYYQEILMQLFCVFPYSHHHYFCHATLSLCLFCCLIGWMCSGKPESTHAVKKSQSSQLRSLHYKQKK